LFSQPLIGVSIASTVAFDLVAPPLSVFFGPAPVLGAAVPEAPVHEHRDLRPREHQIGAPSRPYFEPIHAEAKPATMEALSQIELGFRVAPSLTPHSR
jgi:hypothetical protein